MHSAPVLLTRAPVVLAPAVRLIEPFLPPLSWQDPLLPWDDPAPPAISPPPEIPGALRHRAGALLSAVVEVLRGRRPPLQLEPHLDAAALALIAGLRAAGPRPALRLASVRVAQPAESAVEAYGRLTLGETSHAVAFRLDRNSDGRWLLTAMELTLDAKIHRSRRRASC